MLLCTLRIGDRIVSRCHDGLLEAEYALFERDEAILARSSLVEVREQGYLTTVRDARERLASYGIRPALGVAAIEALGVSRLRAFARSASIAEIAEMLGPHEAFEGGTFDARSAVYVGAWLDLSALAEACGVLWAGLALQSIHLAAVLEEAADDEPVHLSTAAWTSRLRPAGRTFQRVRLDNVVDLPALLARMAPAPASVERRQNDKDLVWDLLQQVNERLREAATPSPHLDPLARALALRSDRDAEPVLAPERVLEPLPPRRESERRLPPVSPDAFREHVRMLKGRNHLRAVAEFLSGLAQDSQKERPELCLLAARAWLAMNETGHARYFARAVVEEVGASDAERLAALEIFEATSVTGESGAPPPASLTPPEERGRPETPSMEPPPPKPAAAPRPEHGRVDIVETFPTPDGLAEASVELGRHPTTPAEARIVFTRVAREVGRDYRLWYGTTLRADVAGVETFQRHLLRRRADAHRRPEAVAVELERHGALLSEILARSAGAVWVDVSSVEMRSWQMQLPSGTRVQPFERVHRFFDIGHREADLVALYLELSDEKA